MKKAVNIGLEGENEQLLASWILTHDVKERQELTKEVSVGPEVVIL